MATDPTSPQYQWPDLWCRRTALGLSGNQMSMLLDLNQSNYSGMESGRRRVPERIWDQISRMESFVMRVEYQARQVSEVDGVITLDFLETDDELATVYPHHADLPALLHRVGVGRAAAALSADGKAVRITSPSR